jgi:hypothetical protein
MPDFITPDWFAGLVNQGVLDMPWQHPLLPNQEVYPVKGTQTTAAKTDVRFTRTSAGQ